MAEFQRKLRFKHIVNGYRDLTLLSVDDVAESRYNDLVLGRDVRCCLSLLTNHNHNDK